MTGTDWLNEIEARANAATPGPWEANSETGGSDVGDYTIYGIKEVAPADWASDSSSSFAYCEGMEKPDAEFIAHARQDIPRLIDEVRRLTRLLAHERELNEDLRNQIDVEAQHATGDCDVCNHLAHVDVYEENEQLVAKLARVEALYRGQSESGGNRHAYCIDAADLRAALNERDD